MRAIIGFFLSLVGILISTSGAPGSSSDPPGASAAPLLLTPFEVVVEENVAIQLRDGVILRADLFRPDAEGKFPALVHRTPYSKDSYRRRSEFPVRAASRGYLVFLVDVRGRYESDGHFEAYRQEKRDGYDTIEWIAQHERCDGKVGTFGGSYPGFVQWLALSQSPPHLVTAVPDRTPTSSHHFFYFGGAFNYTWFEWFMPSIIPDLRRRANDTSGPWDGRTSSAEWEKVRDEWYAFRPLVGVPLLREHAAYYYEWLTHPDLSSWWDFADVEKDFGSMEVPVYTVSGWYDNTYGTIGAVRGFNGLRTRGGTPEARDKTKLMIGPWNHSTPSLGRTRVGDLDLGRDIGMDFGEFLLRWFDRRLKGIENGIDRELPIKIFVMGINEWRYERQWPLARARSTKFYLRSDGKANSSAGDGRLSMQPPGPIADAGVAASPGATTLAAPQANIPSDLPDRYVFDPTSPLWDPNFETSGPFDQAPFESRDDVLVYTSEPLTEDLEVTGEISAVLYVSSDAKDTDFGVMLCDVHPDGTSYNLMGPESGYLRMRYRESLSEQNLMEPGKVYRVTIENLLTSNVFKKRHRIRLQVTSSRAPHFDPNPNTGTEIATETRLVKAAQTLYHDAQRASHIVLPVVPPDRDETGGS